MAKAKKNSKTRGAYGCMFCPFLCYDQEKQVRHYVEAHAKKKELPTPEWPTCEFCQERFRTPEGLDHHLKNNHQPSLI